MASFSILYLNQNASTTTTTHRHTNISFLDKHNFIICLQTFRVEQHLTPYHVISLVTLIVTITPTKNDSNFRRMLGDYSKSKGINYTYKLSKNGRIRGL